MTRFTRAFIAVPNKNVGLKTIEEGVTLPIHTTRLMHTSFIHLKRRDILCSLFTIYYTSFTAN